jgi:catechol 2,3-dioxygenase-like lactoylglutathione lyase family enzyme
MRFRLELFVEDLDASIAFYERALGFRPARREPEYASMRRGDAELGLVPVSALPARGAGPGFSQERLARDRGAGVEIVLEVEDLSTAVAAVEQAGFELVEPPRERPWGLRDFRVADPDGYYVRVTTSGAAPRPARAAM